MCALGLRSLTPVSAAYALLARPRGWSGSAGRRGGAAGAACGQPGPVGADAGRLPVVCSGAVGAGGWPNPLPGGGAGRRRPAGDRHRLRPWGCALRPAVVVRAAAAAGRGGPGASLSLRGQLERQALTSALRCWPRDRPWSWWRSRWWAPPWWPPTDRPRLTARRRPRSARSRGCTEPAWRTAPSACKRSCCCRTAGPGFTELLAAQPAASPVQRDLDVVALLVALLRQIGRRRRGRDAGSAYGTTAEASIVLAALLQPVTLPIGLRRAVRRTHRCWATCAVRWSAPP